MKNNLRLKSVVCSLIFFGTYSYHAQTTTGLSDKNMCGTEIPSQQWEAEFQKLIKQHTEKEGANKPSAVHTIPVIIHVIHGGQAVGTYPNLAQGQLNSQIQVLNNDYGGIGFNSGNYPPTAFTNYAINQNLPLTNLDVYGRVQIANCNIQFCLATKDTLGNLLPEPGIERINYVTKGWTDPGTLTSNNALQNYVNGTIKPNTIWNVTKYLNIWVTAIGNNTSLLGYATFPPLAGLSGITGGGSSTTDGFWCLAKAFGSQTIFPGGTYMTGYTHGRTSTHEIGHYLGLRHTWGDGVCATDFCNDTPPNHMSNFGSPLYPLNATGTNSCAGAVDGPMFMNFMDYTDDPAKYMFTTDQSTRIQTAMSNSPYRKFLGTHNLCSVADIAASSQFSIPSSLCGISALTLTNSSVGTPVPTYTWAASGGAIFLPNNNLSVPSLYFPSPGVYTVTLAADNGTVSTVSKIITIYPIPNLTFSTPTVVCSNDLVTITASGANTYFWLPSHTFTNTISYVASNDLTFTCTATDAHSCKMIDSLTVVVAQCLGVNTLNANEKNSFVYPNPSADKINLKISSDSNTEVKIEITDAAGRIMIRHFESLLQKENEIQLTIESLDKGLYLINIISKEGIRNTLKFFKN